MEGAKTDWLPAVLMGAVSMATALTFFYLAVWFKEDLGFSGAAIGALFAIHAVTGVAVTLPAGLLNDRVTSRTLVLVGLLVQAACLALLSTVRSFWLFAVIYLIWGLATGLFKLSLDVQVLKTDPGRDTGHRLGIYQASRFGGLGIGIVITGLLLEQLSFASLLGWVALVCLLICPLALWLRPTRIGRVSWADYRADLGRPRVLFFVVWLMLFASHWGAEATSYGLFLREDLQLGMHGMGWYMSGEFIAITLTLALAGRHLVGMRRLQIFALTGLILSGIGGIGMVCHNLPLSVAMRSLHGVGDGLIFLVMYYGIARLFALDRLGGNTGFVSMATMLGYVIGALVYGGLSEAYGYTLPLWLSGAITCGLACSLWPVFIRDPGRPAPMGSD